MSRICWSLVVLSLIVIGGMTYVFVYQGKVQPAGDGRTAIVLSPGERDLVLAEMRMFVESIQGMVSAVPDEDMKTVAEYARQVGMQAQQQVPGSLVGKLPLAFKQMGRATHQQFDQLALDAEQLGDPDHSLQQLGKLMQNCIACHATYRIVAEE